MPVKGRARLRLGTLAAICEQAVVTLASALRQLPGTRDVEDSAACNRKDARAGS
jgi:hypothetical protein